MIGRRRIQQSLDEQNAPERIPRYLITISQAPPRTEPSEAKQDKLKELLKQISGLAQGAYSSSLFFFFFLPPPPPPPPVLGSFWRWTTSRVHDSSLSHSNPVR